MQENREKESAIDKWSSSSSLWDMYIKMYLSQCDNNQGPQPSAGWKGKADLPDFNQ